MSRMLEGFLHMMQRLEDEIARPPEKHSPPRWRARSAAWPGFAEATIQAMSRAPTKTSTDQELEIITLVLRRPVPPRRARTSADAP